MRAASAPAPLGGLLGAPDPIGPGLQPSSDGGSGLTGGRPGADGRGLPFAAMLAAQLVALLPDATVAHPAVTAPTASLDKEASGHENADAPVGAAEDPENASAAVDPAPGGASGGAGRGETRPSSALLTGLMTAAPGPEARPFNPPVSPAAPAAPPPDASSVSAAPRAGADVRHVVRSPDTLVPALRERLGRVVARMEHEYGHHVAIAEAGRTQARQDYLFAQGRTRSGPVVTWTRDSNHTRGRAVDVTIDGSYNNAAAFALLQQVARTEGLHTLGARDPGHLELPRDVPGELEAPAIGDDARIIVESFGVGAEAARPVATAASYAPVATPAPTGTDVAAVALVAPVAPVASVAAVAQVAAVAAPGQPAVAAPSTPPSGLHRAVMHGAALATPSRADARLEGAAGPRAGLAAAPRSRAASAPPSGAPPATEPAPSASAPNVPTRTALFAGQQTSARAVEASATGAPAGRARASSDESRSAERDAQHDAQRDGNHDANDRTESARAAGRGVWPGRPRGAATPDTGDASNAADPSPRPPRDAAPGAAVESRSGPPAGVVPVASVSPEPRAVAAAPAAAAPLTAPTLGAVAAERIASVLDAKEAAAPRTVSHLTLRVERAGGSEDRIRLDLRGRAVEARIDVADLGAADRLAARAPELRAALARHGLTTDDVRVGSVGPATAPEAHAVRASGDAAGDDTARATPIAGRGDAPGDATGTAAVGGAGGGSGATPGHTGDGTPRDFTRDRSGDPAPRDSDAPDRRRPDGGASGDGSSGDRPSDRAQRDAERRSGGGRQERRPPPDAFLDAPAGRAGAPRRPQ